MHIKECYISHNGISCFTNINSLVNVKDIKFTYKTKNIVNIFNINNFIFYFALRCSEFIIKDLIKNKIFFIDQNFQDKLLPSIIFS